MLDELRSRRGDILALAERYGARHVEAVAVPFHISPFTHPHRPLVPTAENLA